jgi:hypothetical protein
MSGTTPVYDFTRDDRRFIGSLNLYSPGVVLLSVDLLEPSTSNRWHHNRVFAKSTLSKEIQEAFARYRDGPSEKAFAMAPGGAWGYQFKGTSTEDATQKALQHCQQHSLPGCRIILLNNDAAE